MVISSSCSRLTSSNGVTIKNLASMNGIIVGGCLISVNTNEKTSDSATKAFSHNLTQNFYFLISFVPLITYVSPLTLKLVA